MHRRYGGKNGDIEAFESNPGMTLFLLSRINADANEKIQKAHINYINNAVAYEKQIEYNNNKRHQI